MEFLFPEVLRILVAVFLVVALIKFLAWLVRGFGSEQTRVKSRRANPAAPPRRRFARVAAGNLARADEQASDQVYENT